MKVPTIKSDTVLPRPNVPGRSKVKSSKCISFVKVNKNQARGKWTTFSTHTKKTGQFRNAQSVKYCFEEKRFKEHRYNIP